MLRLLVVEDQEEFYQDYLLRHFQELLPMEQLAITHVTNLEAACQALVEPWDAILMDYALGPRISFLDTPIRDGADLTAFRRAVEAERRLKRAFILGMASNMVANQLICARGGADGAFSKLHVAEVAKCLLSHFPAALKVGETNE